MVWVRKEELAGLYRDVSDLRRQLAEAKMRVTEANVKAVAADSHASRLVERVLAFAGREPTVLSPPDASQVVRETLEGVATVLNGWRGAVGPPDAPQLQFDDRTNSVGVGEFVPPWEQMGPLPPLPPPAHASWVNPPTNGNYTPYVPGAGNLTPPEGGVE